MRSWYFPRGIIAGVWLHSNAAGSRVNRQDKRSRLSLCYARRATEVKSHFVTRDGRAFFSPSPLGARGGRVAGPTAGPAAIPGRSGAAPWWPGRGPALPRALLTDTGEGLP